MEAPWYGDGLRFTCRRCGDCCGGAPGHVWVTEVEIEAIAAYLGMDRATFERDHVRPVGTGRSLVDKADCDCIFFDGDDGCRIYPCRPRQCRTWPFWRPVICSRGDWEMAAENCPGMGTGEFHTRSEIAAIAAEDGLR